jgi:Na+/H+ antiporter NhaA
MNGAEAILRTLLASGVDTCFANPGTSEMAILIASLMAGLSGFLWLRLLSKPAHANT